MELKQCANGHFYEPSRNAECPYCNNTAAVNATRAMNAAPPPARPPMGDSPRTVAAFAAPSRGDERTQALIKKDIGIDPVVGWLVAYNGPDKGRDYRIHADNNFIGRSESMDVCIRGDDTVSRENHAIISYDMRDGVFYFTPGEGRSIVRVNGKAIFATIPIAAYDRIEVGNTQLVFIPLCGESFSWSE